MTKKERDAEFRDSTDPFFIHETVAFSIGLIFAVFLMTRCGL